MMFMIIREPSARGGDAAAMSAPQERTAKQVRGCGSMSDAALRLFFSVQPSSHT